MADQHQPTPSSLTPPQFTASHNSLTAFKTPLRTYLATHPQFDGIGVGAFVFKPSGKLLLLQRAPHDSMPLRWEVPGGACDLEDETILHSVARELHEESGLLATRIMETVGGESVFFTRRNLRMCKYSFLVETEGFDVKLDPNEHVKFLWVDEKEAREKKCGDVVLKYTAQGQEESVYEAFGMWKTMQAADKK